MTIGAGDERVRPDGMCLGHDLRGQFAIITRDGMDPDADAAAPKIVHQFARCILALVD